MFCRSNCKICFSKIKIEISIFFLFTSIERKACKFYDLTKVENFKQTLKDILSLINHLEKLTQARESVFWSFSLVKKLLFTKTIFLELWFGKWTKMLKVNLDLMITKIKWLQKSIGMRNGLNLWDR